MPDYWRIAFKNMGNLCGLVPYDGDNNGQRGFSPETTYRRARAGSVRTVHVGGVWSLGSVLMEPVFYNPHLAGWWGAAVLDDSKQELQHRLVGNEHPQLLRSSNKRRAEADLRVGAAKEKQLPTYK